jgi:hypothetical protein
MEYKKILQWISLGLLIFNYDFGASVVPSTPTKTKQINTMEINPAQKQTVGSSKNKNLEIKNVTPVPGAVPVVKPVVSAKKPLDGAVIPANPVVRGAIPPLVGAASGAASGAAFAKTLSPSSNETSPSLNRDQSSPFRHDKVALNKFLKENKVFKTIYDSNSYNGKNSFDPETIELFVPHYDNVIGSKNKKITYKQLLDAYKDIEENESNPGAVSQQSTQIVTSFSLLNPFKQQQIKEQEVQVEKIKNLVVEINTNMIQIKTNQDIQSKLLNVIKENLEKQKKEKQMGIGTLLEDKKKNQEKQKALSKQLEDKKKNQENLIKMNQVDLSKDQESIGNGSKQKQANKTNANYKETELKNEETELKNLQYRDPWIEDQILRAKADITKIEEKLNSYNKEKIGQDIYESIFEEISIAKEKKNGNSIFQKKKKDASKSWFSFSSNTEPIDAKFLTIIKDGNNQTLIIDWFYFFKDIDNFDLTYLFPIGLKIQIEKTIEDLTIIKEFCSNLITIKKTTEFEKFCNKYFYDKKDYPSMSMMANN